MVPKSVKSVTVGDSEVVSIVKLRFTVPFYFDHNSTTPVDPRVFAAFQQATGEVFGNASSIHHFGQEAKQRLEEARRHIASLMGASPREVVLTGGGTESDNLAIFGAVRASAKSRKHVITTEIEHPAVLGACNQLVREGAALTVLPVNDEGVVDPEDVRTALRPETVLVSVMHANNETGVVQPLRDISAITRAAGVLFHSDGVQAAGRLPVNVEQLGVDFYSISAHKMNAPKGVGALYVRDRTPLRAVQCGGHHERELRAGTENVAGAVAFGVAAQLSSGECADHSLRDRLESGILTAVSGSFVNGRGAKRLPNTTNICFPAGSGEAMVIALDLAGFAVSSGAACSSGSIEPSHVLLAMGLSEADARASVRFSLGLGNTAEQVDLLIQAVAKVAGRVTAKSPWQAMAHA